MRISLIEIIPLHLRFVIFLAQRHFKQNDWSTADRPYKGKLSPTELSLSLSGPWWPGHYRPAEATQTWGRTSATGVKKTTWIFLFQINELRELTNESFKNDDKATVALKTIALTYTGRDSRTIRSRLHRFWWQLDVGDFILVTIFGC